MYQKGLKRPGIAKYIRHTANTANNVSMNANFQKFTIPEPKEDEQVIGRQMKMRARKEEPKKEDSIKRKMSIKDEQGMS